MSIIVDKCPDLNPMPGIVGLSMCFYRQSKRLCNNLSNPVFILTCSDVGRKQETHRWEKQTHDEYTWFYKKYEMIKNYSGYVSSYYYMCPHTTMYCPHTTISVCPGAGRANEPPHVPPMGTTEICPHPTTIRLT
jgi:hypothetical protein